MTVMPSRRLMSCSEIHHHLGVHRIERGDRLVGEDHLRLLHQRAGNRHALLLAARQRAGGLERGLRNAQPLERGDRRSALFAREHAEQVERGGTVVEPAEQHVGQHVEARHEVELLEDHGAIALPAAQRRSGERGDFRLVKKIDPWEDLSDG